MVAAGFIEAGDQMRAARTKCCRREGFSASMRAHSISLLVKPIRVSGKVRFRDLAGRENQQPS
jgi:hypothetical protein